MQRNEHNDLLIQQLRSQIYQLKKSQQDYYLLQQQLNRLQTKYKLLSDQKISNDKEHETKHNSYVRLIQQTKHQLVILEDELKYKQTDLKQIDNEGLNYKRLCEERNHQLERLKLERNTLLAEDQELKIEDQRINNQINKIQIDIQYFNDQYEKVSNEHQNSFNRNKESQKYLNDLINEGKLFIEDIKLLEDKILNSQNELESKSDNVRSIEKQIYDATSASKQLEIDISQVNSQNQKYKGEIHHYTRLTQSEIMRANDIIKSIDALENSLKMLHEENLEVVQEIEQLEKQNAEVMDINIKLELDNENCQKHIDLLGSQNQYLMAELDKLAEEDEVVRTLLTRKKKAGLYPKGFDIQNNMSMGMALGMGIGSRVKGDSGSIKLSRTSHQSRY